LEIADETRTVDKYVASRRSEVIEGISQFNGLRSEQRYCWVQRKVWIFWSHRLVDRTDSHWSLGHRWYSG
ncbi:hypothetical protein U1Q18_050480, partial [Sarracenia purpurea var. burkii]